MTVILHIAIILTILAAGPAAAYCGTVAYDEELYRECGEQLTQENAALIDAMMFPGFEIFAPIFAIPMLMFVLNHSYLHWLPCRLIGGVWGVEMNDASSSLHKECGELGEPLEMIFIMAFVFIPIISFGQLAASLVAFFFDAHENFWIADTFAEIGGLASLTATSVWLGSSAWGRLHHTSRGFWSIEAELGVRLILLYVVPALGTIFLIGYWGVYNLGLIQKTDMQVWYYGYAVAAATPFVCWGLWLIGKILLGIELVVRWFLARRFARGFVKVTLPVMIGGEPLKRLGVRHERLLIEGPRDGDEPLRPLK